MRHLLALAALAAGAVAVTKQMNRSRGATKTSTVEESIEIDVPARSAYNQWTQFEDFPRFMHGVIEVRQLDDKRLRWRAEIGGKTEEWESEITEQIPDKRIAWRSLHGPRNAGVVTFHRLDDERCRVMLQMNYEPRGVAETLGDMVGAPAMRVCGNLQRFKDFLESRGSETGAWRGSIDEPGSDRGSAMGA
ncbi:MAG TPA: SRPBCC family protein [Burkholderiaceae bacterium]|nr:SRPBCC family protein [Burkholderiaceae bacterium]